MNEESGSFNIENDSPINNSIKTNNDNENQNNEEELILKDDNYVEFNPKNDKMGISINSLNDDINMNNQSNSNNKKYEKNKDFPTPKDYNKEIKFYNNNEENKKNEEDKELNIEDLNGNKEKLGNFKKEKITKNKKTESNKMKNDFTFGKMNDGLLFEKNKKKFIEEFKSSKIIKNNLLIVQPKNSPIITELEFTKNNLKNSKKNKKSNKKFPILFKQNNKFNQNKHFFIDKTLYNDKNYFDKKDKKENLTTRLSQRLNMKNSFLNFSKRKNIINFVPLKKENNIISTKRRYYPNNFDFLEYQRLHSLNSIQPSNTFENCFTYRTNLTFNSDI